MIITETLSPSHHIAKVVRNANQIVSMIRRTYEDRSKNNSPVQEPSETSLRPCSHLFRFAFRSRSGPVPLVRVAFTPAKIDRNRSGCGLVTRSHLFRNATGTRTVTHTHTPHPPPHTRFLMLGLLSSRRMTALTASRHQ